MESLADRIIGVETEFGCLVEEEFGGDSEQAVEIIKNCAFYDLKLGAIDVHARDEVFEPVRAGGFMLNGSRLYVDAVGSHLEYATAETRNLKDLISQDRAGQRIILRAIQESGLQGQVKIYSNSVDHFGGHTFGCHENYLVRMTEDFFTRTCELLYPFFVTRQVFAGVGRVGGHILTTNHTRPNYEDVVANPIDYIWVSSVYHVLRDDSVRFQLSQRADHILKTVASRVRFNRALINPKWEHYYSHDEMQRMHILFGEANQNEYAYALKVGTTHLALRLAEDNLIPENLQLSNPIWSLKEVSRDENFEWNVLMVDGTIWKATDVQRAYLELAQRYRGEPQTDWILDEWALILDTLDSDPLSLGNKLDWVAKLNMITSYVESEGLEWNDPMLHALDLEYHNIDPKESLFYALQDDGQTTRVTNELAIIDSMTDPPKNTRAFGRSKLVAKAMTIKGRKFYGFDWNAAVLGHNEHYDLSDPFETYANVLDE